MTVYADAAFFLNAIINYVLLLASARLSGARIRRGRMALAAGGGGLYAAAALWPELGFLGLWPVKGAAGLAMLLTAFGRERGLFRLTLLFFGVSAAFGGLMLALCQFAGTGLLLLGGGAYYPVSFGALLLAAAAVYGLCHGLFSGLSQHRSGEFRSFRLTLNGRSVPIRALVDTGNTLKDPITNEPVLVANCAVLQALLPEETLSETDFSAPATLVSRLAALRPRLIPYRAVGVESGMLLALRCEMQGENETPRPVLTAFSPTPVSDQSNFNALTGGNL